MTAAGFDFDRVIAPTPLDTFLASYYERSPLIIHRADAGYYDGLLGLDAVWTHIETRCPAAGELNLIKLGCGVPEGGWCSPNGRADPSRVAQLYNDGWTIGLNKMHEHLPSLADLCAAAEAVFSSRFQTNLYLTPPGAQGFKPHWDTHDVFVMQVYGSKEWTLYDTKIALPLVGQSFDNDKPDPGPATATFTLRAGDMLYCPRGLMHSAASSTDASLHITFGLMGRTWSDFMLEVLSEVSLRDPALRRNLPTGFARPDFDRAAAQEEFTRVMAAVVASADFPAVFAQTRDQFVSNRMRRLPGYAQQLTQLDRITADTRMQARPSLIASLELEGEAVTVNCGGAVLTLPDFTEAAVRASISGSAFTVAELPGPLDTSGKVTLVRRLAREGLLQRVA